MTATEWFSIDKTIRYRQFYAVSLIERECLHWIGLALWSFHLETPGQLVDLSE